MMKIVNKVFKGVNNYAKNYGMLNLTRSFNIMNGQMKVSQEEQVLQQKTRNQEVQEMTELVRDFLDPGDFFQAVKSIAGIEFFCGVPDSLLKDFCAYVTQNVSSQNHVITANEGQAIALASGYHMATGKSPLVYLQNSGLGNIINPVMSLAVPNLFSVPILLVIGWRGEPGKRDEPQHIVQGQITPGILATLGIPFQTLPDFQEGAEQVLASARHYLNASKGPYCLLVRRQTFLPYKLKKKDAVFEMNREEALKHVLDSLKDKDVVVGTTGMLSREIYEYRKVNGQGCEKDFLTIGSMGHCSAIALGVSLFKQKRQVFCLDGDGSVIMHMGSLATIGQSGAKNLKHIIFNNGVHDSVGAQPTAAGSDNFSFCKIALGCGYKNVFSTSKKSELSDMMQKLKESTGPSLIEIKCNSGHRKNLGRPKQKPIENKNNFMHYLAIE